jgi:hypothetical protein
MTKRTVQPKKSGTKRAGEKPVDAEIRRAAERIGIPPEEVARQRRDREEQRLIADRVGEKLILACDQLGEELAAIADIAGGGGNGGDDAYVMNALVTLWRLRWDLGLFPNKVEHGIVDDRSDDDESEQAAEGGAL